MSSSGLESGKAFASGKVLQISCEVELNTRARSVQAGENEKLVTKPKVEVDMQQQVFTVSEVPCRQFQRGHCHYGDRCKFKHVPAQEAAGVKAPASAQAKSTSISSKKPVVCAAAFQYGSFSEHEDISDDDGNDWF